MAHDFRRLRAPLRVGFGAMEDGFPFLPRPSMPAVKIEAILSKMVSRSADLHRPFESWSIRPVSASDSEIAPDIM